MFQPVGKPRVAEEIVRQLRGLILRGEYAVGDKLPPERKLAEELGVNRASLREAIKALEHMGLVKTRQGDGTRVLDFMQTAGVELISHLVPSPGDGAPNVQVLLDVLEFRRLFGRESVRLAAERATAEDIKAMEAIVERSSDSTIDAGELLKYDFELYVLLAQAGKNAVMRLLINTMRATVMSYAPFFAQFNAPPNVVRKHQRDLVKAVATHDVEGAVKVADAYLKKGLETVAASVKVA
jgi:GntR family transcriptional regulator, transcriptional repressor for pyruvate dehydrogenase complex